VELNSMIRKLDYWKQRL